MTTIFQNGLGTVNKTNNIHNMCWIASLIRNCIS